MHSSSPLPAVASCSSGGRCGVDDIDHGRRIDVDADERIDHALEDAERRRLAPTRSHREPTTPTPPTHEEPAPAVFVPGPFEWEALRRRGRRRHLGRPGRLRRSGGPDSSCSSRSTTRSTQENRIGTLLVNPGGPGFGGTDFALFAAQIFDQSLLEHFDILAWDPRGTGESEPTIDCIDDYDPYFNEIDSTPESDEERQLLVDTAEKFADECMTKNADISSSSARTTALATWTRSAVPSVRTPSPTSGSATAASSAPRGRRCSRTRCAPQCSTAPPTRTPTRSSRASSRLAGFDSSLTTFLADCSADRTAHSTTTAMPRGRSTAPRRPR